MDNVALSFGKNRYRSLGFIMCWATNHSSSTYYDVWSWLSTWLGWEALGKLVKNTLLGVSVEVYLETKGMRVSKLSEIKYTKCGHHTAHGAIGWRSTLNKDRRRKPMHHPRPALFEWVRHISFPSWTWSSHSSSLSLYRPIDTSNSSADCRASNFGLGHFRWPLLFYGF